MSKIKTKKAGITLIALVLTIIVLLILAGITINLTIGQEGILKRAEEAGRNYTQAAEKEKTELAQFSNLTDKIIDNVTKNHYTMVNGVPVPKGFSHKEGTKDTGFVIKNDTDGNEFVWVPVDSTTPYKYERVAFSRADWDFAQTLDVRTQGIKRADLPDYIFTEIMPGNEQTSVKTYGGFYIGRYESGVVGYDNNVSSENANGLTEWTGYTNGKLVIQKGKQVWNYITRDKAKKVSEGLYSKTKGDSVNSKLSSSYAWDTALKLVETKNLEYAINTTSANYKNQTFNYVDLDGNSKTKQIDEMILVPTGQTVPVNNIYDLGGNVWEWSTEEYNLEDNLYTIRGGHYSNISDEYPAAIRNSVNSTHSKGNLGFRITLFL